MSATAVCLCVGLVGCAAGPGPVSSDQPTPYVSLYGQPMDSHAKSVCDSVSLNGSSLELLGAVDSNVADVLAIAGEKFRPQLEDDLAGMNSNEFVAVCFVQGNPGVTTLIAALETGDAYVINVTGE